MEIVRQIVVFDAADLSAESSFWAGVLGGRVTTDDDWHTVYDAEDAPRIGVQLAPDHVRPQWPDGAPQQVHLDLYIEDLESCHNEVLSLGAKLLKPADDVTAADGFQVYEDPAGHPFCLCWG